MGMKPLIRFDWAIKRLLRDKANYDILEGFLSELLKESIKILEILESESNRATAIEKSNRVDMLVKNSKGEHIIIEIQNTFELDYFHRILFGASKLITEYIDEGRPYKEIKKVISISILYFDIGQGKDYIYKGINKFTGLHEGDVLQLSEEQKVLFDKEHVEDIFPQYYIIKVNSFNDVAKDTLDEWIYFLKNAELPKGYSAQGLIEANTKLKVLEMSETERREYDGYLDHLSFERSVGETDLFRLEYARKEGIEENKRITAKKMKSKGFPIEEIMEITGLTEEEIIDL